MTEPLELGQWVRVKPHPSWGRSIRSRVRNDGAHWLDKVDQVFCQNPFGEFYALVERRGSRTGTLVFFHVSELIPVAEPPIAREPRRSPVGRSKNGPSKRAAQGRDVGKTVSVNVR